ncbi:hypothetical protein J4467_00230 [Candidatus Woesearchaeota archaeon]|nr:hypothetical protein [Candidatus Woesearchaeota archaeon]
MEAYRFGVTYLLTHSGLSKSEKIFLIKAATQAYLTDESRKTVVTDNFQGVVSVGNYATFGGTSGVQFDVSLDHNNFGKVNLRFLVHEHSLQNFVADA